MRFYLNYVLASSLPPSHSPGGGESNVPFPTAPSPPNRHHDFVPFSPWLPAQARVLPSHHRVPLGKIIINDDDDDDNGKSADTSTDVPEEKVLKIYPEHQHFDLTS